MLTVQTFNVDVLGIYLGEPFAEKRSGQAIQESASLPCFAPAATASVLTILLAKTSFEFEHRVLSLEKSLSLSLEY